MGQEDSLTANYYYAFMIYDTDEEFKLIFSIKDGYVNRISAMKNQKFNSFPKVKYNVKTTAMNSYSLIENGFKQEGIEHLENYIQENPDSVFCVYLLSKILIENGEEEKSLNLYKTQIAKQKNPKLVKVLKTNMVTHYMKCDENEKALNLALSLEDELDDDMIHVLYYNIACIYAKQNDVDNAVKYLEELAQFRYREYSKWKLKQDSDFDKIRDNPKFGEVLKKFHS